MKFLKMLSIHFLTKNYVTDTYTDRTPEVIKKDLLSTK